VTVSFNTTIVRDDESAGSLTFMLVTNRPADESFTVQVCTRDIDDVELGSGFELESSGSGFGLTMATGTVL